MAASKARDDTSLTGADGSPNRANTLLTVSVVFADAATVWSRQLALPAGATIHDAIAASGFSVAHPGTDPWLMGVGVFGRAVRPDTVLVEGDRIEIYRPLSFDPTVSRRRRALHKSRRQL